MRAFASVLFAAVLVVFTFASPARAALRLVLTPPVVAPVIDSFRLPSGPYGPGNRGLEYATTPGQAVVAAAGGVVVFSGQVAGTLHVTLDHGGGLLTSYSFLDRILVDRGEHLARGDRVGLTGSSFHFSTRLDGVYVDPQLLLGRRVVRVRLVPVRSLPSDPSTAEPAGFSVRSAADRAGSWPPRVRVGGGLPMVFG